MTNLTGQSIGRYQILEQLGEGGMATVYKAYDTRLERDVAVKIIRTDQFAPAVLGRMLRRFEREARALAKLSHPNIVKVLDYGETQGAPYLVLEYLPGGTLKQLTNKPMPWQEAARLVIPIARALQFSHLQGIIHRDIKPSNILITLSGEPMLSDFGIARIMESDEETTALTATGMGMGTPEYMAPEQWTGQTSAQSDIYSLGVVLYELVTGRKPYVADTPAAILLKQANEPLPPPSRFAAGVPPIFERILLKALSKRAEDRFVDMRSFAAVLEKLLMGQAQQKPPLVNKPAKAEKPRKVVQAPRSVATLNPVPWWPNTGLIIGIGLLCVVVLSVGAWLVDRAGKGVLPVPSTPMPTLTSTLTFTLPPVPSPSPTFTPLPTLTPQSKLTLAFTNTPSPTLSSQLTITLTPIPYTIVEIADDKGVAMMLVPAGDFIMGNSADAALVECQKIRNDCQRDWFIDQEPQHIVYLDAYYMDKFEVTNKLYKACVDAAVCRPPRTGTYTRNSYYGDANFSDFPVIYTDWNMAMAYCEWRGARLPTEAEWEKAARGTYDRIYPWGNSFEGTWLNFCDKNCIFLWNINNSFDDAYRDTAPIGSYPQNVSPYGVYDMAGNVREWVADRYGALYYSQSPSKNPLGPEIGETRVSRGGGWGSSNFEVMTTSRTGSDPNRSPANWRVNTDQGFRCARSRKF